MSVNSKDQLVIRGDSYGSREQLIWTVTRQTGNKTAQFKPECCHIFCPIIEHPVDPNFALEVCRWCEVIRSYNINTTETKTVCAGYKPWTICRGPEGSVFVIDKTGALLQLEWRPEKEELELVHRIQTSEEPGLGICYMEQSNILVMVSDQNIKAINPETGSVVSEFTQDVEGKKLDLRGVSYDLNGRIYVADGHNERLVVLNGETREVIQVSLKDEGWVFDVCWTSSPPQLTVLHGFYCSTYNVIEQ